VKTPNGKAQKSRLPYKEGNAESPLEGLHLKNRLVVSSNGAWSITFHWLLSKSLPIIRAVFAFLIVSPMCIVRESRELSHYHTQVRLA
jgi:hypothetical protein